MDDFRKKIIFLSFLLVDFFAAMETTALTVAAPKIGVFFGLEEKILPWLINSYLYTTFFALLILLVFHRQIRNRIKAKNFFLEGVIYFLVGSLICFFANTTELFFFGRIVQGIGGAMAFAGQLWTMTESFRKEIAKPLFWTQVGFASGIVIGPVLGGIASTFSASGWRLIFALNALVCFLIAWIFARYYITPEKGDKSENISAGIFAGLDRNFAIAVFCEGIFSLSIIAIEFIFSIYAQNSLGFSPLLAAGAILIASFGIILGSERVSTKKNPDFSRILNQGLQMLTTLVIIFGILLQFNQILLLLVDFFLMGIAIGYISVATYAYTAQVLTSDVFVSGAIIYLIAMQLGNALGIETESVWNATGKSFLLLAMLIAFLLQVALFFANRLKNVKSVV
jgi:MFS family permease